LARSDVKIGPIRAHGNRLNDTLEQLDVLLHDWINKFAVSCVYWEYGIFFVATLNLYSQNSQKVFGRHIILLRLTNG